MLAIANLAGKVENPWAFHKVKADATIAAAAIVATASGLAEYGNVTQ